MLLFKRVRDWHPAPPTGSASYATQNARNQRIIVSTLILIMLFATTYLAAESWTVLVYMAGDNNLWQNAVQDVNDMESAAIPPNLNLIVQTDLPADSPYPGGQRRRIVHDFSDQISSPLLENLGAIDSGDPQTLNDFIKWGFDHYRPQRYILVIWGHGDNWFKRDEPKWICPDDGAQSLMSVANGDLRTALEGIPPLDILIFDACSMQSLEVLAEVYDKADYVVGSEELVPAAGFPYQTMIPLFADGDAEEVAIRIAQKYLQSYEPGGIQNPDGFTNPITCSAIRTAFLPSFYAKFRDYFFGCTLNGCPLFRQYRKHYWEMNTGYCDVDVGELVSTYAGGGGGSDELIAAWESCVAHSGSLNILGHQVGSAAIWFPYYQQYFDAWWQHYAKLEFAQYRWLNVLYRSYGDPGEPPPAPVAQDQHQILNTLNFKVLQPVYPDSLLYYAWRRVNGEADLVVVFTPAYGQASFVASVPITGPGLISLYSVDPWGNVSDPTWFAFDYEEPGLELMVTPNPLRDKSLAALRWYLPVGGEEFSLKIYNLKGQLVWRKELTQAGSGEGIHILGLDPDFVALGRGVYLAQLKRGRQLRRVKFTIL